VECGAPIVLTNRAKLYCSEACHQTLKLVHYIRRTIADGRWERDPTIEDALQIRLANILGGGYHETARHVPPKVRVQVFERDGGKCVLCGAPAAQIDHIAGDANALENLRATCGACNLGMAQEQLVPATGSAAAVAGRILDRIFAPTSLHPRDDELVGVATNVRLLAERRERVRAHLAVQKILDRLRNDPQLRERIAREPRPG
jgi:5-methylcytosine-specific restriction endonuclease McrA